MFSVYKYYRGRLLEASWPVRFFNILITWQPVTAYRDNSVKRDGNSHVIAFCRVGSATRVERFHAVYTYLQRNKYLIFYLHDVGKLCKRIINHVEAAGLLQGQIDEKALKH